MFGGGHGDAHGLCGLLEAHADEIPSFDELRLAWIDGGEAIESLVDSEELIILGDHPACQLHLVERDLFGSAASFRGDATSGPFDEDSSHGLRSSCKKVGTILEGWRSIGTQAQPDLMDECGGLQGLARAFAGKFGTGEAPKLGVNEGKELLRGFGVSTPCPLQDASQFIHGGVVDLGDRPVVRHRIHSIPITPKPTRLGIGACELERRVPRAS